jgi:hypothetical protein
MLVLMMSPCGARRYWYETQLSHQTPSSSKCGHAPAM